MCAGQKSGLGQGRSAKSRALGSLSASTICELEVPGLSSTHESHAGSGKLFSVTRQRVADWQRDPDVRGLLLVGSKSLGFADRYSDDDLYVVLTESAYQRRLGSRPFEWLTQRGPGLPRVLYDICYTSVSALSNRLDSPRDVDHWEFQRAELLFDRDGTLASLPQALAAMPGDFRRKRLMHGTLDAHMAQYRANKTLRRGGAHFIVRLVSIHGGPTRHADARRWLSFQLRLRMLAARAR